MRPDAGASCRSRLGARGCRARPARAWLRPGPQRRRRRRRALAPARGAGRGDSRSAQRDHAVRRARGARAAELAAGRAPGAPSARPGVAAPRGATPGDGRRLPDRRLAVARALLQDPEPRRAHRRRRRRPARARRGADADRQAEPRRCAPATFSPSRKGRGGSRSRSKRSASGAGLRPRRGRYTASWTSRAIEPTVSPSRVRAARAARSPRAHHFRAP